MSAAREKPFRFGICLVSPPGDRAEWVSTVRRAEAIGYDVLTIADHLGRIAPIASLMLAAEASERMLIGTSVLNTAFYTPVLLAREIAGIDRYSGGRVEAGLGAGFLSGEFDVAGMRWPGPGERVTRLEETVEAFRNPPEGSGIRFDGPGGPRIAVAGRGDRVLRLAARRADVVALTGTHPVSSSEDLQVSTFEQLGERVDFVNGLLGDRADDVELSIPIQQVLRAGGAPTDMLGRELGLSPAGIADVPAFLAGSPRECADQLRERRERLGLSYFTIVESEMEAFAPVLAELR